MMGGMGDIGGGFDGFGTPMGGGGMDMPEASAQTNGVCRVLNLLQMQILLIS